MNFQMFKLDLEKAEEPEIKLSTSIGSSKKQQSSRKTSISALLTMPKPLCGSQQTVENSSREGNTRLPCLPPEKSVCRSEAADRTGHGTTEWFQTGKSVHQSRILSTCLFNLYAEYIMRNESRLPGEISVTLDMHMESPLWKKAKN